MKSDILLTLIKEVVKNEVKQQVKEEVAKLIKSGAVTLNTQKKSTPSLKDLTEVSQYEAPVRKPQPVQQTQRPQKEFSKDPMINEILNMTTPFTSAQRVEGGAPGMGGGSVLDMLQPQQSIEGDWETMDYRDMEIPQNIPQQFQSTGDELQDATIKALTRDYSELVKRFK
jgi:hypothetical protein